LAAAFPPLQRRLPSDCQPVRSWHRCRPSTFRKEPRTTSHRSARQPGCARRTGGQLHSPVGTFRCSVAGPACEDAGRPFHFSSFGNAESESFSTYVSSLVSGHVMEKRESPRIRALKEGKAILSDWTAIDCTIRELGKGGARLKFGAPTKLPEEFRLLYVSSYRSCAGCLAAWRIARCQLLRPTGTSSATEVVGHCARHASARETRPRMLWPRRARSHPTADCHRDWSFAAPRLRRRSKVAPAVTWEREIFEKH
jgi:hypothetical protein